jgi:hypothetical protein
LTCREFREVEVSAGVLALNEQISVGVVAGRPVSRKVLINVLVRLARAVLINLDVSRLVKVRDCKIAGRRIDRTADGEADRVVQRLERLRVTVRILDDFLSAEVNDEDVARLVAALPVRELETRKLPEQPLRILLCIDVDDAVIGVGSVKQRLVFHGRIDPRACVTWFEVRSQARRVRQCRQTQRCCAVRAGFRLGG